MEKGKTIWEMFRDRIADQPAIQIYNPLDQVVGMSLSLNAPQYKDYDFTIKEIREYTRKIAGKTFIFTDYVLEGMIKFDAATSILVRLRVMPTESGTKDVILLRLYDDLPYDRGLESAVRDTTGEFEVTYDDGERDGKGDVRKGGDTETYTRINDLRDSYSAKVMIITEFDEKLRAVMASAKTAELEYWDYWRELDESGRKRPQFLFVEMNKENGWFKIWQGEPYYL